MYEGPTIYETNITNYYLIGGIAIGIIAIIFFMFLSLAKIFKKADKSFVAGFIPFYNLYVLIEVCNLSKIYFILSLIPGVNIIITIMIAKNLAEVFNKKTSFMFGLLFLPIIFYPILAFSNDRYIGINNQIVEEIVLTDIVKEQVTTNEATTVLKTDQNISVGTTKTTETQNVTESGVLQADTSILDINKPKPPEYTECPNCKNKVKKEADVCFMCGFKLK